jgi:hypothetical protein
VLFDSGANVAGEVAVAAVEFTCVIAGLGVEPLGEFFGAVAFDDALHLLT